MVLLHSQGLQVPPSGFGSFQGTLTAGELASPWSQSSALAQQFPGLTSNAYGHFLNGVVSAVSVLLSPQIDTKGRALGFPFAHYSSLVMHGVDSGTNTANAGSQALCWWRQLWDKPSELQDTLFLLVINRRRG